MRYNQLTLEQRYQIHSLRANGKSNAFIARRLGVHRSTIGRELHRNRVSNVDSRYMPAFAQKTLAQRRFDAGKSRRKVKGELKTFIEEKIRYCWSPEQISGRLKRELGINLSHEAIYRHIVRDMREGGDLRYCLRLYRSRRKRFTGYQRRLAPAEDRRPITSRPKGANSRRSLGHWERDLVEGRRGKFSLLSIVDRKSRFTLVKKVTSKESEEVNAATAKALRRKPRKSITNDNGREFSYPEQLEKKLKTKIFFCRPYASWERGTVENTNGLIRQYFPKKTDFNKVKDEVLELLENSLNLRPRKTLKFLTPHEVFYKKKLSLFG